MAPGVPDRGRARPEWLQEDEAILHDQGRHPASVLDIVLGISLLAASLIAVVWFLARVIPPFADFALGVTAAILVPYILGLLMAYWRVKTSRFVITDDRIYSAYGRFRFVLAQTTYDKVTDLQVRQSIFGRLWGYGNVTAQTAGTGLAMPGVRHPLEVKRRIERARLGFIERLLEAYGLEEEAQRAAAAQATETAPEGAATWRPVPPAERLPPADVEGVIWRGGPVAWVILPALITGLVLVVIGTASFVGGMMGGEMAFPFRLMGPFFLLVGVIAAAQGFIHYRCTRFAVTRRGVVVTSGWLSRKRVETTFDKVTDVSTYQGIVGRLLDYGNIKINTAGSNQAPVNFTGLARPKEVKELIDGARRARESRRRGR